jgi:hypothetical protein
MDGATTATATGADVARTVSSGHARPRVFPPKRPANPKSHLKSSAANLTHINKILLILIMIDNNSMEESQNVQAVIGRRDGAGARRM